jgi:hypothetical protein
VLRLYGGKDSLNWHKLFSGPVFFDDPTPSRMSLLVPMLLAARANVRNVSAAADGLSRGRAAKAGIGTQMLFGVRTNARAAAHDRIEHGLELCEVMMIRRGHDDRQRDATSVDRSLWRHH